MDSPLTCEGLVMQKSLSWRQLLLEALRMCSHVFQLLVAKALIISEAKSHCEQWSC